MSASSLYTSICEDLVHPVYQKCQKENSGGGRNRTRVQLANILRRLIELQPKKVEKIDRITHCRYWTYIGLTTIPIL